MFHDEYVRLVIKPKVDMILEDGVDSIGQLTARFNETFECKVSKSRIAEWLKLLGYRVTRVVHIARPERNRPQPQQEPRMQEREEFRTEHRQMQFNYPAPQGVFSNVQMPGFQE